MTEGSIYSTVLLIALILPLVSAGTSALVRESYSWLAGILCTGLMLISGVLTVLCVFQFWGQDLVFHLPWFKLGSVAITAGIHLSQNALVMLTVVSSISILVHLYSIGYMIGDRNIRRYFVMLGIFTSTMNGIVIADNLLLLFIFWELVGFSSFMLIGHWTKKIAAGKAAFKAFLLNRMGDSVFLIGLMILWTDTGTLSLTALNSLPDSTLDQTAALLCMFAGVIAKSAQFPLFTWLPDAMEGPTPVSALIHAATMVAAGVYLLVRISTLTISPIALDVITYVGMATAFIGALGALAQFDLKRILAYSTVSQLGLMVMSIGAGATDAAFFHLFTHAFFKACLFLSAGSISHSLKNSVAPAGKVTFDVLDIREHGGLRANIPITFVCFVISASALAGLPLTTGFMSKEAMLLQTLSSGNYIVFGAVLMISFLTAIYSTRMIAYIFLGSPRNDFRFITESPPVMRFATVLLAAASLWLVVSLNPFAAFPPWATDRTLDGSILVLISSVAVIMMGISVGYLLFRNPGRESNTTLANAFYVDSISTHAVVPFTLTVANSAYRIDRKVIDVVLHGLAYGHVIIAHVIGWLDKFVVDGLIDMITWFVRLLGNFAKSFQSGKVQGYVFWALLAMIIFIIWSL